MWLTPCSSKSSSARSASRLETLPSEAAPKIARLDSWPVAPKGARSIMAPSLRPEPGTSRRGPVTPGSAAAPSRPAVQNRVEPAGAERLAVDHGVGVAGRADGLGDLGLPRERPPEVVRRDLDPAEDAVVAHAQDREAERPHGALGAVDQRERRRVHRGAVRDAGGEA